MSRRRRIALWVVLLLFGVPVVAAAWLFGTTAGLRAGVAIAHRLTGGALTIERVDGRLLGDVLVEGFAYEVPGLRVALDRAELNLRLLRLVIGRIQAERLDAGVLVVATRDDAAPPPAEPPPPLTVRMPLRLAVEDGRLGEFRLERDGALTYGVRDATFAARWRDEWIVVGKLVATTAEFGPVQVRGRIAIADDLLQLEDIEARGIAEVRARGALAIGDRASSALELEWKDFYPVQGGGRFGSPKGSGRLDGPWSDYAWRLDGPVQIDAVPGTLAARGRGSLAAIDIERLSLQALAGELRARGRMTWSPRLATQLALDWERIDPATVWPAWAGVLNGEATLAARRDGAIHLEFDAALRDSKLRGYPFALKARGRTEDRKVFLKEFQLSSGASVLAARGQLLPELALEAELHSSDLRSLWAGLTGRAELRGRVAGALATPHVVLDGAIEDVVYGDARLERASIDVDVDLAPRRPSRLAVALSGARSGSLALRSLDLTGSGTRESHRAQLEVAGREGRARLVIEGAATASAWSGRLVEASVQPPKGEAWALEEPTPLSFTRARFTLEPACLAAGASRACAELGIAAAEQHIAFRTRDFDLAHVRAWMPAEWNLVGALSGTASLDIRGGELREIRADLAATAGSIEGGGVKMEYGPGSLRVGPDGERLGAQLELRPAGGTISAEVWVSPGKGVLDRPMLGDLRIDLPDLAWLPVLSAEIAGAQGALSANLHVSGTPRSPSLDGKLDLSGGRVQLATPGIELTNLTASFERGRDAPLRLKAQATSGEGQLRIDGEFATLSPQLVGKLTIQGKDVLGVNRTDLRAWLSPDLVLTLDGKLARLTGELAVPRAEITPREIERAGVGTSGDQVLIEAEGQDPAQQGVRVEAEVRIALGDNVHFDGLGLKTRLTGALTAVDTPEQATRGYGELRLEGGRYKAYGQDLQIETGRLLFTGGPINDPAIDVIAFRKPTEEVKVGLRARGHLASPQFSLFSEPAMTQEEQLSWLVLGRSLTSTLNSHQRTQLSGAAFSLGLTGGDYLAGRLAPRLGLDEVSLGSKPGETADLARFTIGKYLSPKLFVSYGYGLFQPGHFFRLQYDIGRRFKLVGESGVQQGGDVLYTIER